MEKLGKNKRRESQFEERRGNRLGFPSHMRYGERKGGKLERIVSVYGTNRERMQGAHPLSLPHTHTSPPWLHRDGSIPHLSHPPSPPHHLQPHKGEPPGPILCPHLHLSGARGRSWLQLRPAAPLGLRRLRRGRPARGQTREPIPGGCSVWGSPGQRVTFLPGPSAPPGGSRAPGVSGSGADGGRARGWLPAENGAARLPRARSPGFVLLLPPARPSPGCSCRFLWVLQTPGRAAALLAGPRPACESRSRCRG